MTREKNMMYQIEQLKQQTRLIEARIREDGRLDAKEVEALSKLQLKEMEGEKIEKNT